MVSMKKKYSNIIVSVIITLLLPAVLFPLDTKPYKRKKGDRVAINFNTDWLFLSKDIPQGQSVYLNEKQFKPVCLPHTNKVVKHSAIDTSSFAMIAWYRKHFIVPAEYKGRCFSIEFQAVAKVARVYCNGELIGEHKGAYTPFTFDITEFVKIGVDNVIAVRVDSRQRKDIPPEGIYVDYMLFGGIVRDVTLMVTNPLHVNRVYAVRDSVRPDCVDVTAQIVNNDTVDRSGAVTVFIVDSIQNVMASVKDSFTLSEDSSYMFHAEVGPLDKPQLWHPDHPYLYTIFTQIQDGKAVVDEHRQRYGIRSVSFGNNDGKFYINDQPLKLRGLNRHETFPFIGRAAANRLQSRDAEIIKYDFGCNIVRCSHYPQDPEFLDRCDEIGLLVLEEMPGWSFVSKSRKWQAIALKNVEAMVMRDRNHPSIISFGVRINQSNDSHDFYTETNRIARTLDPSRPTHGVRVLDRGRVEEFLEDIWTQNFAIPVETPPVMPWITTESVGHRFPTHSWDEQSRLVNHMLAHAAVHDSAAANPKIAGLLGWCAFDYHSSYRTAEKNVCYHGVADMFRLPKHAAFFYRSQADPGIYGPMVYIAHTWEKGLQPNDIWIASNCDSVELFVNNVSQGKCTPSEYLSLEHPLYVWRAIPYTTGELRAVGFINSTAVATAIRKTPGPPVALAIEADDTVLTTGGDMTRIVVTAVDSFGQTVSRDASIVKLKVKGAADFLGESPIALEDGKTAFFVKTRAKQVGTITCSAHAQGLTKAKTAIKVYSYFQ